MTTRLLTPVNAEPAPEPTVATRRSMRMRTAGAQGYAIGAIAMILIVAALRAAEGFFLPVAFSVVIALTFAPLVRRMERLLPRWIASGLVVVIALGGIG